MSTCKYINCPEPVALEGLCGDHYNEYLKSEKEKKDRPLMSPAQIKKAEALMKELDQEELEDLVNLGWWFEVHGEEERPSKFMNRQYYALIHWNEEEQGPPDRGLIELARLPKKEAMMLNDALKELDGTSINGGTHIWRFTGKKHFLREGTHNHFRCIPIEEDQLQNGAA